MGAAICFGYMTPRVPVNWTSPSMNLIYRLLYNMQMTASTPWAPKSAQALHCKTSRAPYQLSETCASANRQCLEDHNRSPARTSVSPSSPYALAIHFAFWRRLNISVASGLPLFLSGCHCMSKRFRRFLKSSEWAPLSRQTSLICISAACIAWSTLAWQA